jgi:drug/metabolite transporter (DMT)-like permease
MTPFVFVATVLIWGTTWLAISFQIGPVPVLVSVFYRFALSAAILWPVMAVLGRLPRLPPADHLAFAAQGLFLFCLNFICFYNAERFVPSGLIAVMFSLASVYNAVNSRLFFGDRITGRMLLATAVGVAGLILLFHRDIFGQAPDAQRLWGIFLGALGTLSFSFGNMISRRNSAKGIAPFVAMSWAMTYGSLMLAGLIWVTATDVVLPPPGLYRGALVYLALIGTIAGFGAYLTLVARIGPARAAYATVLFPVIALMLSSVYEGYEWTATGFAGLALTVLGNVILFVRRARPVPLAQSEPA